MGATKKTTKTLHVPRRLKELLTYLWGPGRTGTAAVLLLIFFTSGVVAVWRHVRPHVLASGQYTVAQEKVLITPLPNWIHADVRAEVFRDASLDGPLSILDDDLSERLYEAFSLHPWIAKVQQVRRRSPARVEVELVYRRPVCMVDVPGEPLPVDADGVLLPNGDFSPVEKNAYPHLMGIDTVPMGPVGQRWGDGRVAGGAEIAAALAAVWQQLKLDRIVPATHLAMAANAEPTYLLYTRGGTRIVWGLAPGSKAPEEAPAAEKVGRLLQYVADHGTLDGRGGPQELDIHTLPALRTKS